MRILFEKEDKGWGGDLMALSRLSSILGRYKVEVPMDDHTAFILDMWLWYIHCIENHVLASNLNQTPPEYEFDLPFEKDFANTYPMEGK